MATKDQLDEFITSTILSQTLEDIVGERFGRYSKYIIQDRAIPDVRDGLKPVQRRILYAMYLLKMFSNSPFKKIGVNKGRAMKFVISLRRHVCSGSKIVYGFVSSIVS